MALEILIQGKACPPIRDDLGILANNHPLRKRPARLDIFGIDAIVADQGVGHCDNLAAIPWIRKNLLVAGHGGIEDNLTRSLPCRTPGSPLKDSTIFKCENGFILHIPYVPLHLRLSLSKKTLRQPEPLPVTSVFVGRSCPDRLDAKL